MPPGELRAIELVFSEEIQAILDHFCALFGIRIAFFSPDGDSLRVGQRKDMCAYCRLLRGKLERENQCRALDESKRKEAGLRGGLVDYVCHGGLHEAIMPVYGGNRLAGFIMIGQFRTSRSMPRTLRREWGRRWENPKLQEAFLEAPYYPPKKVKHVLGLFEMLVRFVTTQHMVHLKDVVSPVLARMREQPERPLSLKQAAALVHRSPSGFSHLFRRVIGRNFKRAQIESRLEKADELFRNHPGMRVREVAFKLGFEDPLYFSRLYRKYRGVSPSRR